MSCNVTQRRLVHWVWCVAQNPGRGWCRTKRMFHGLVDLFWLFAEALFCFPSWIKSDCNVGCCLKACEVGNVNKVRWNNINYEMSVSATIAYDKKINKLHNKTSEKSQGDYHILCYVWGSLILLSSPDIKKLLKLSCSYSKDGICYHRPCNVVLPCAHTWKWKGLKLKWKVFIHPATNC